MSSIIRRRRGLIAAIWGSPVSGVGCTPPDPGRREITHRQIRSSHLGGGLVQSAGDDLHVVCDAVLQLPEQALELLGAGGPASPRPGPAAGRGWPSTEAGGVGARVQGAQRSVALVPDAVWMQPEPMSLSI